MNATHRGLLAGLLLVLTGVAFESQSVATAMPAAAQDLGQLDLYAWAFTAFVLPQIVAIVVGGRLCDTVGPTRPMKIGVAVFALGIVLSAVAVSMPMLLAGRFVQGLGGGLVSLTLMVMVGRAFPPHETGRVMSWFSAAWMLPSFLGPSLAAIIVATWSWHVVFWAVLPIVGLGVLVLTRALAGHDLGVEPDEDAAPVRTAPAVAVASGIALIQAAGQRADAWSFALAGVGVGLLAWQTPRLMPHGWSLAGRGLDAVVNARPLLSGAFTGYLSFVPLMVVQLRHIDLMVGGWMVTIASLGWTLGSFLQSRRWMPLARDTLVSVGTFVVGCAVAFGALFAAVEAIPVAALGVVSTIGGIGMGLAYPTQSLLVMQLSDQAQLGRNTSSLQVAEQMGNSLFVGLAGGMFAAFAARGDTAGSFAWPFAFLASCALASVVVTRRIGRVENLSARTSGAA